MANAVGFALYFMIYAMLIALSALCASLPVLAIAAVASMAVNFVLSCDLVSSSRKSP
jgi:hypothetical protein